MAGVADHDHPPARPHQPGGVAPAAQGLLAGAQVDAGQHQPGVQQDHRRVAARRRPARRPGSRPRCRAVVHVGQDEVAARGPHPGLREGAAELLGGAGLPQDRRPQAPVAALGARPGRVDHPAPAARRRRGRAGQGQRPGARRAARGRPAALARQRGGVPPPRGLHQDRPGAQAGADRLVHLGGDPGGAGVRVALEVALGGAGDGHGHPLAQHGAGGGELAGPARCGGGTRPRRCGRSRRPGRRCPRARRAAAASRGCGGTARAARRAGRRRRPRSPPAPGRAPARSAAARVPTTIRRAPRLTARKSR